jgi:putative superfamily III holin-X
METTAPSQTSIMGLVRHLAEDTKKLLRQEIELAKAELSEKVAVFGRNAVSVAVGGFIAYAGLIVLLIGLGWLVAWALEKAGLQPVLAGFIGLAGVGVLVAAIGATFLFAGLKAFSKESLAPQRTIHTIQRLKKTEPQIEAKPEPAPKRSSQEMEAKVLATEDRMTEAMGELGQRLTPREINARVKHRIEKKPYHTGFLAMAAGVLSGFFITRAARRS